MKRYRLVALLFPLLLLSCRKDRFIKDLTGSWEITQGYTFGGPVSYPPGNGNILVLRKDRSFEQQYPGNSTISGYYTVETREDCSPRTDKKALVLHFDNSTQASYVGVSDNTLSLSTSNCIADGGTAIYRRLN